MSLGGQMFGLRVANLLPAFTFRSSFASARLDFQIGLLSHGDLSPDTAAQLWPVLTAFPDSTKGKNCLVCRRDVWDVKRVDVSSDSQSIEWRKV